MSLKCQLDFDRLTPAQAPPTLLRGRRPLCARSQQRQVCRLKCGTEPLLSVSAPLSDGTDCRSLRKMKRSHTYSSSESDLDDNVDVEKESGDENGYVHV